MRWKRSRRGGRRGLSRRRAAAAFERPWPTQRPARSRPAVADAGSAERRRLRHHRARRAGGDRSASRGLLDHSVGSAAHRPRPDSARRRSTERPGRGPAAAPADPARSARRRPHPRRHLPADRLAELVFELPLAGGDRARPSTAGRPVAAAAPPSARRRPSGRLSGAAGPSRAGRSESAGLPDRQHRRRPPGPRPGRRTRATWWWTTRPTGSASSTDPELRAGRLHARPDGSRHDGLPTTHCRRCCTRWRVHRMLRWRQPDYRPDRQLGGVLYLFVRGMAGRGHALASTAFRAGCSAGARPPDWSVECSDLLERGPQ